MNMTKAWQLPYPHKSSSKSYTRPLNIHLAHRSLKRLNSLRGTPFREENTYIGVCRIIHTFWLVLTNDQFEDRRIHDVTRKKLYPLLYKSVISDTLGYAPQLFCSYHILTSSVIFYWTDVQQVIIYWFIHEKENLDYRESLALSQEEECPFPSTMCPAT